MIEPNTFSVEPWAVTERELRLGLLGQAESLFALSNGHIGLRGNLDEGEPHHTPGTYLNGFFESLPLPYAEGGYGYPEQGQSLIDVTNGKLLRLLVDDEPFDVRYGTLERHERTLDLRGGVLRREVAWVSPAGQAVRIRSTRLVSFVQRAVAAIRYEVEPLGAPARIVVQSTLVANEPVPSQSDDPRAAAALRAPLEAEHHAHRDLAAELVHRTRASKLRMAAGFDHLVAGPGGTRTATTTASEPDLARVTISTELEPGQRLTIVKLVAYGWSSERSVPALRDQVAAALAAARRTGWDGLVAGQRAYLDEVWERADVVVEGDPRLQQAVRFALFQVVQAAARAEQRAIPAKGLTGRGYDGHAFWDTEAYTLPVAAPLLLAGLWVMLRRPGTPSLVALLPGLLLATAPSLPPALAEPASGRGLLLGLAALALVGAGARLSWVAPFAVGVAVTVLLSLRHLTPVADALPRWVLLATAGLLLLTAGTTWERRARDARRGLAAVRAMR